MKPSPTDVLAVIVNWNSSRDSVRVVDRLILNYPELRILVVDNASTGPELTLLRDALPDAVEVLERPTNDGYGAGVNDGVRRAAEIGAGWVWLINPDSLPFDGCLENLLSRSQGAVALAPQQISSDLPLASGDPYVCAAVRMGVRRRMSAVKCSGCDAGVHDVDVVTGTGLLVSVAAATSVGLMDESYFHYKEEFDFVESLGRLGDIRYVCAARLWHQRGASMAQDSPSAIYYRTRNEILYLRKRHQLWWLRPGVARMAMRSVVGGAATDGGAAFRAGFSDGFRGRVGKRIER